MAVEFVRELDGFKGAACLVRQGDDYFVVSSVDLAFDTHRPETLVFPADADGKVTSWGDVAGGMHYTREQAIAQLEERGAQHWMDRDDDGFGDTPIGGIRGLARMLS